MAYLIEGHAVEEKKVVGAVSSMYIHPGQKLVSSRNSGKGLDLLYQVGRTKESEAFLETASVDPVQAGLCGIHTAVYVSGDAGFIYGVALFFDEDRVVLGLLL